MARLISIVQHDDGKCHVFESDARGSASMGESESLAAALVRRPGVTGDVRIAVLYEAVRSARRAGFTREQIAESVARAHIDADAEDARSAEDDA